MTAAADDEADADLGPPLASGSQRLDKWLWFARVVKTRTMAAGLVTGGKVRLNRERIVKPSQIVRGGDVLTVTVGPRVRVLEVRAPGTRRGPPTEAQALFRDLTPPAPTGSVSSGLVAPTQGSRPAGAGRPTKRDRRALDRFKFDQGDG